MPGGRFLKWKHTHGHKAEGLVAAGAFRTREERSGRPPACLFHASCPVTLSTPPAQHVSQEGDYLFMCLSPPLGCVLMVCQVQYYSLSTCDPTLPASDQHKAINTHFWQNEQASVLAISISIWWGRRLPFRGTKWLIQATAVVWVGKWQKGHTTPSLSDLRTVLSTTSSHRERPWSVSGRMATGEKTVIRPCPTMEVAVSCVDTVQSRMKWDHCRGEGGGGVPFIFSPAASSMAFPLQQLGLVCFSLLCFPTCLTTAFSYVVRKSRETMLSKDPQSSQEDMGDSTEPGPAARVPAQAHSNQATLGRMFNLFCLSFLTWEISY